MIKKRVEALRKEMLKENLSAYLITGTDPHGSEYVPLRFRTREFISGFSGSAGTVLITKDKAFLWTDSRYFLQAEEELVGTKIELMKDGLPSTPSYIKWIKENLNNGERVGVCGNEISIKSFNLLQEELKEKKIEVVATDDILNKIWKDRPPLPSSNIYAIKDDYVGFTSSAKINFVRQELEEKGCDWTLISSLDDIAWLSNLRSNDVKNTPVFLSFLFISKTKAIMWVGKNRFNKETLEKIEKDFDIREYEDVFSDIASLTKKGVGYYSEEKLSASFSPFVFKSKNKSGFDITTNLKAEKNPVELEGMRRAHFLDGIAFINFLSKLDRKGKYSEIEIEERLESERKNGEGYLFPSFDPISAYKEHGAIVHYSASEESNMEVSGNGLLVLDTGSHYEFGTTDLTRTLFFGDKPTDEEKKDYTLVLKGHLALSRQVFPSGTRGVQLDVLAKQFLWGEGENFLHGTGHGVGFCLSVHEGPENISSRLVDVPLKIGMIISDEPGVYKTGKYGIRIENLLSVERYAQNTFGEFLSFEVLSMVPYEKRLIDTRYLTDTELSQINFYHKWVHDNLIDYIEEGAIETLEEETSPITREE